MKILLLTIVLLLQSAATPPRQTGTISGRLRAVDAVPMAGVRVAAMVAPDDQSTSTVLMAVAQTDASGLFRLDDLVAGRYLIVVGVLESPVYYPGVTDEQRATTVSVAAGSRIEVADFIAWSVIRGQVLGLDGVPATGVTVMLAAAASPQAGARGTRGSPARSRASATVQTDADGHFRLDRVPVGRYVLSAGLPEAPTYFPGVTGLSEASTIVLDAPSLKDGVNFRLALPPVPFGVKVSGRVLRPDNQPVDPIFLTVNDVRLGNNRVRVNADGGFSFVNVRPGTYSLSVGGSYIPSFVTMPSIRVTVGDRDIEGLRLEIPALVTVSERVILEGGGLLPPNLQIVYTPLDGGRGVVFNGSTVPAALPPGGYRVLANGLEGYLVKSFTAGATNLQTTPLNIAANDSPQITLTLAPSSPSPWVKVSGRVTGSIEGALQRVSLFPANGPGISAAVNRDGSFEFPMVGRGTYTVRASQAPGGKVGPSVSITVGVRDITGLELIAGTGSRLTPTALPARAQLRQAPVIEFVKIPPGDFVMGCSNGDAFCEADEKPAHRVYITRGFELGKFELTQKQWETVMGFNPSRVHAADKPVDNVSWNDAQEFISVLTSLNDGYRYRLPTEAEWEYAARAGVSSAYTGWLDTVGWHQSNASEVQPIGTKTPNAFGLYDMEGNVYEWVQDWYSRAYYRVSPANDPPGPSQGQALPSGEFNFSQRVARSGSIGVGPRLLRVSNRATSEPDTRSANYGFRVAREALR